MSAIIYLEGGGESRELHARCRKGFRQLLLSCGFDGRMPRLVACGGRGAVFSDFQTAHGNKVAGDYVAMWIDSEDPLSDLESAWTHLKKRDNWEKPNNAVDDDVLFMTTCMETFIVADRAILSAHYGSRLQPSALPSLDNIESINRHDIQNKLEQATRSCSNFYKKGKRAFEILAKLSPDILKQYLPSFMRAWRILNEKL